MSVENIKQNATETIENNTEVDDKVSEEDPSDDVVDNNDTPCNQQCTLQTQEDLLAVCR